MRVLQRELRREPPDRNRETTAPVISGILENGDLELATLKLVIQHATPQLMVGRPTLLYLRRGTRVNGWQRKPRIGFSLTAVKTGAVKLLRQDGQVSWGGRRR
jgi:hypothetical protein